ncbi:MAG: thiol:disulfide interchange protein DsbA/DsbL, partial [Proteobacteria bacterium]
MKIAFALVGLLTLSLAGCGGEKPSTSSEQATLSPEPAAAPPAEAAPPATAATIEKAAKTSETSVDEGTDKADARLERMAGLPESAQLPSGKWKAGTNYQPISPAQPTSVEPGQVEVMEVFWYGCPHCNVLDPTLETWKKSAPSYVKFVRVPVMWGPVHRAHARLFYTLESLGKLDALHSKVFAAIHQKQDYLVANDDAQTRKLQLDFAKANGISEADFTRAYDSFGVNASLQR